MDLIKAKDVLVKTVRSGLFPYLLLVVLLPVAFISGRYTAPVKIVEKRVEVTVEKLVEVEKKTDTTKIDEELNKHTHKERTVEIKPDGTQVVKETTDTNTEKNTKEVEVKYVDREVVVEKKIEVTVEKIVESGKPDWTVTARVGVDINRLLNPSVVNPILVGVEIDRRIIGPFKAGVWVQENVTFNTWPTAGVAVSAEF